MSMRIPFVGSDAVAAASTPLDVRVNRVLQRLDWHVIHVIKEDCGADIVEQARDVLMSRGWGP